VIAAPPEPKFTCVIEMVPVVVMKTKTNVDFVPVCTKTVMELKIDTVYDEQTQTICKPIFDTVFETRSTTICRPVCETSMVPRTYTVCRPVTTTEYVTEYCTQAYTEQVPVACGGGCGQAADGRFGCRHMAARICFKQVPVLREVTRTHWVTEVQTQMVPVVQWRTVAEQKIEKVPVTTRRTVEQVVRIKVPRLVFRNEPKTLVYRTAVLSCQEIPVTVYRPVAKMVPVAEPSEQALPTSQVHADESEQAEISDDE
jgi:hypothetical protein